MIKIQSATIRVAVPVGNEDAIFICERPTGKELSAFLTSRFRTHRNKITNVAYEVRPNFAKSLILDAENISFENAAGEVVPLNNKTELTEADKAKWSSILGEPVVHWRDLISVSWLCSVAMYFEESSPADESEGN